MPRPKKTVEVKNTNKKVVKKKEQTAEEVENLRYIELIDTIRKSTNETLIDAAFQEIAERLKPRMQRVVFKFNIPGYGSDDVLQEALFALRFKAIKDYDINRGAVAGPAPFERFAILCIRRHLATEFKASYQNKKKVLNSSMSLDQEQSGGEEELSLINIIPAKEGDVSEFLEQEESFKDIIQKLMQSLSRFEKQVFILYAQRNSYEEIAEKINAGRVKIKVNIKGIDNALSRIKHKGRTIIEKYEKQNEE